MGDSLDLRAIRERLEKATPGPWDWFGNVDTKTLYLATPKNGRQMVMSFGRYGMQGSKPLFSVNGVMVGADRIARFEVCPEAEKRDDERVYRGDVLGIKHPDAEFIARARTDVPALLSALEEVEERERRLKARCHALEVLVHLTKPDAEFAKDIEETVQALMKNSDALARDTEGEEA